MFCLWSFDYFRKTTNQLWIENSKMTGIKVAKNTKKNNPVDTGRKLNVLWTFNLRPAGKSSTFLKLKENWLKKMNGNLSNQSQVRSHMLWYTSNCRRSFIFFQLPYLEHDFMINNLVRLNLIFWKYWRRPRNILVLC